MCPVGMEPVLAFEYKWWNTMPSNMMSSIFREGFSHLEKTTGEMWENARRTKAARGQRIAQNISWWLNNSGGGVEDKAE